jgi:hypothetical protein
VDHNILLRLIRFNGVGPLNRTLVIIPSRFEYFSRMGLSYKVFNNSTRNYEMVHLVRVSISTLFRLFKPLNIPLNALANWQGDFLQFPLWSCARGDVQIKSD